MDSNPRAYFIAVWSNVQGLNGRGGGVTFNRNWLALSFYDLVGCYCSLLLSRGSLCCPHPLLPRVHPYAGGRPIIEPGNYLAVDIPKKLSYKK
jgi:hypothetical protein